MAEELAGLERVCRLLDLVDQVPALQSSMFVGLEDVKAGLQLKLSSEISVSATLKQKLGLEKPKAVDRRLFLPFVDHKGTYKAEVKGNELFLRQGRRKARIPLLDVAWSYGDWHLLKKSTPVNISPDLLRKIECARMCAADQSVLPELNGVYVEFGKQALVFAANDMVMCFGKGDYKLGDDTKRMVIPLGLIPALVKERVSDLFMKERTVGFELDGARVWSQAPEKAWDEFPADRLKKLILESRKDEPDFIVASEAFATVCKRFAGYLSSSGMEGGVILKPDSDRLRMKLNAGGVADYDDSIKAEIKSGEQPEVEINLGVAHPIFDFVRGKNIKAEFTSLKSVQHLKVENFEFLLSTRMK